MATLCVVGGLPAVGKTAVCREILRLRAEAQPPEPAADLAAH